jgi:hypothetical protein
MRAQNKFLGRRVVIWFARNPDECLTTTDIAAKFNCESVEVAKSLRDQRNSGWLRSDGVVPKGLLTWYAGPELLKAIEQPNQREAA